MYTSPASSQMSLPHHFITMQHLITISSITTATINTNTPSPTSPSPLHEKQHHQIHPRQKHHHQYRLLYYNLIDGFYCPSRVSVFSEGGLSFPPHQTIPPTLHVLPFLRWAELRQPCPPTLRFRSGSSCVTSLSSRHIHPRASLKCLCLFDA